MLRQIHAFAGVTGFFIILTFWISTVFSELFGGPETVAMVKIYILWGMVALVPMLMTVGASGMKMGSRRKDAPAIAKKKRMPFIAINGMAILVPSAFFLAGRADAGVFDNWFYGVQVLELVAGATNLTLMGLNIRDGLKMSRRFGSSNAGSVAG